MPSNTNIKNESTQPAKEAELKNPTSLETARLTTAPWGPGLLRDNSKFLEELSETGSVRSPMGVMFEPIN